MFRSLALPKVVRGSHFPTTFLSHVWPCLISNSKAAETSRFVSGQGWDQPCASIVCPSKKRDGQLDWRSQHSALMAHESGRQFWGNSAQPCTHIQFMKQTHPRNLSTSLPLPPSLCLSVRLSLALPPWR